MFRIVNDSRLATVFDRSSADKAKAAYDAKSSNVTAIHASSKTPANNIISVRKDGVVIGFLRAVA